MKKSLLLSIAASVSLYAAADLGQAGYYRVQNYKTGRYVSVVDNRGRIDYKNTTADLRAIQLQKDFDVVCADPASVLYIAPHNGTEYQIEAQGTGIYQIISHYLNLKLAGTAPDGQKLYNAYGEMNGVIKYLGDGTFFLTLDIGKMVTNAKGEYIQWYITPVSAETDNFFGIQPTLTAKKKHYASLYTSFPYSPYSNGIKTYYVKDHYNGMVLLEEITGTVPAGTPVIVECGTDSPSSNRVSVGGSAQALSDNKLKGVYFNCSLANHINRVAYDKETMRVPGVCKDGTFGFITDETLEYIPANTCYITVDKGSPAEYKIVSASEFHAGIGDLRVEDADSATADNAPKDVYNLQGQLIKSLATPDQIKALPAGLYIVGGKKILIR